MRKVYRIKLTDFEIRVLIHILADFRNDLIVQEKDTSDVNALILRVIEVYERSK